MDYQIEQAYQQSWLIFLASETSMFTIFNNFSGQKNVCKDKLKNVQYVIYRIEDVSKNWIGSLLSNVIYFKRAVHKKMNILVRVLKPFWAIGHQKKMNSH